MAALYHIQEDGHRYENLKSNFLVSPVWKNNSSGATRHLIISVSFLTWTINRVLVGMIFLGNDNFQSFILKKMRSVNLKAVTSKFKITFHIFRDNMHTDTRKTFLCNFIWA
jgi:hypothetical protein